MNEFKMTPELAEIIGIYVGDGYLRYDGKRKELDISGGYEEKEYYDKHVIPLFKNVFGISLEGKYFPARRTYGFVIRHREVLETFKALGFPSGNKSLIIRIPTIITTNNKSEVITSFLRGYFDTDGCLTFFNRKGLSNYSLFKRKYHYYPRIILVSVSEGLVGDLKMLLDSLGFRYHTRKKIRKEKQWNPTYEIYLVGQPNLMRWMTLIGTKNTVKLSRYKIWRKFGFCPTNTTYDQRINILAGKLNPQKLYKGPVA